MKAKKERNYKDEYKKFQSGGLAKKYRAALNKFNRESEKKRENKKRGRSRCLSLWRRYQRFYEGL